ncbi:ATP-binding protein [Algoriphagus machipongonensis]|uniref:histidine kinase n=1 Tax=Algoriphagus machipongonensis TaxID=388413 RepID=A3HZT2_9BACT|nr:ATP-binding protein [Algoriphagus machipongonensis]EAZ80768.1 sensor histidine kinase/response regulator [Algoriphagus machipongonensis]
MKKNSPSSKTASKVVIGFIFATIFLIGVAGLTYYTLNRLVKTVAELAEPNQKLNLLNELQAEIFEVSQIESVGPKGDFRVQDSTINSLNKKLDQLDEWATDDLEKANIEIIRNNLSTLITGYVDLFEVKNNLANRNFTREALRKVELGIRRRASEVETAPLRTIKPSDIILNQLEEQNAKLQELPTGQELQRGRLPADVAREEDKLVNYLKNLQKQNTQGNKDSQAGTLDSILYNIRGVISRIYREESYQRQKLATLESELSQKQSEIIGTIQQLLRTLQRRVLEDSDSQNVAAYGLANDVIFFLVLVVAFAVLGSAILVYSILKEIRLNRSYQENLLLSQQKAEQLAKSKQEFLANMSHEIRNPLHVIQGYQSVLEKSHLDTAQQSYLRMIGFASQTLMEIVDDVLDFSKLEAGKLKLEFTPFDPVNLFGSLQNFFELQADEKNLGFHWSVDLPEDKWLLGDQLRLKQILNNLLSNAFKFTEEGSINVGVKWVEGILTVEIKDTGIGMSEEVLEKVFLEFDQADNSISRKFGGTGLGLAIVHRLVHLMHGEINTSSKVGVGTCISISLPMETTKVQISDSINEEFNFIDLTGKKVLLVDDDKVGLKYLETILTYFGAEVISFPGGIEYRDNFEETEIDLAITDIQMPEFSGFEVVKSLRGFDAYEDLPILAMTANVFVEEKEKMMQEGFDELLFKPFQEKALVLCLGNVFPDRAKTKSLSYPSEAPVESNELFDLKDMKRFCMGDEALLLDILKDLIKDTDHDMKKLHNAREEDRWDEVLEICHQLGSRLGQIKSPSGELARKVENSLKLGTRNGLDEVLNLLELEVERLLGALSESLLSTESH